MSDPKPEDIPYNELLFFSTQILYTFLILQHVQHSFRLYKKSYVVTENSVTSLLAEELRDISLHAVYANPLGGNADANLTCLVIGVVGEFCKRRKCDFSYAVFLVFGFY
jgi:hypothetical protein